MFVAVKSYDTEWATALGCGYLASPHGVVVDFQNGINDERVAAVAGLERTLGCVILIAAGMYSRAAPSAATPAAPASRSASTTAATRPGRARWPR